MHKICCLFSLVRLLLEWKTALEVGGNNVHTHTHTRQVQRNVGCFVPGCDMSRCLIWHSAATRALWLRHFLRALSTCSPYCAGIFYIWQELGSL